MKFTNSEKLFNNATKLLVGGVNSPVRAFKSVGGTPVFFKKGVGSRIIDEDDNVFIDYVGSWGPMILGHAHPEVVRAVTEAVENGFSFGASHRSETQLAELVNEAFPSMEMIRFVNSGTEAVMSALRVARGFTGRNKIVKFSGCYHGHGDFLLAESGSGVMTLGMPGSAGVPENAVRDTLTVPYNDRESLEKLFAEYPDEIAAVILEPVTGNMGVTVPGQEYLRFLRDLTARHGALLIFDEVMTGFRFAFGGVQKLVEVNPDLTCLGKIIGGGLPVGAYGGRREIMEMVAPLGPVYQAGTLSGNPVSMAGGVATLKLLRDTDPYPQLSANSSRLAEGLQEIADRLKVAVKVNQFGSMLTPFFTSEKVHDYQSAKKADTKLYAAFFRGMLERGVFLPPSQFEAWFVSAAHTKEDIEQTLASAQEVLKTI